MIISAKTEGGIDALITIETWRAFLDNFVDNAEFVARIAAQSPRYAVAGYAARTLVTIANA
jgi:hypothetical protein